MTHRQPHLCYRTVRAAMRLVGRTRCPVTVTGVEHIPATGPVILAGNHLAVCDTFFLYAAVPRAVAVLGKEEYFTRPGVGGRLLARYYRRLGVLPVDRYGGPSAARAVLDTGHGVLHGGGLLALYPEGTRSPDGRLYRGRPGAAALALVTGAPLLPFGITGTDRVQPIGTTRLRPHPVRIRFGPPLDARALVQGHGRRADGFPTTAALRETTLHLMHRIADLSGQDFLDLPAPRKAPPAWHSPHQEG
ncbi:lysophospholipid acyltransferase family protein [Streptomyces sp. NPDC059247]|uniref:lysophospholipid acyltransferase family protein n=1 Tax=Streptomyces sp. NPDC059247 TaxID=3346790 RepID=UPI0036A588F6